MSVVRGRRGPTGRLLAVAAVAIVALAGCSESSGTDADPTATTPSATATSQATTTATTAPALADLTVVPGAVGPVAAGMTEKDALATGLLQSDVDLDDCGVKVPLGWNPPFSSSLDVQTSDNGVVISVGVRGDQPRTTDGLGVGSTLADVSKVYETAELTGAGYGQTGIFVSDGENWLGFLFDADPTSIEPTETVSFMEVTSGTQPDLMRDGC